jgi:hypothetical protein
MPKTVRLEGSMMLRTQKKESQGGSGLYSSGRPYQIPAGLRDLGTTSSRLRGGPNGIPNRRCAATNGWDRGTD